MFNYVFMFVLTIVGGALMSPLDNNNYYKPTIRSATMKTTTTTTEKHEIIPLLKYERSRNSDGSFHFAYEGADKSYREETAHVINADTENEALEVSGSYRYIDADGQEIEVHYTAGKNGFVPLGTNISPSISAAAKTVSELSNDYDEKEQNNRRLKS